MNELFAVFQGHVGFFLLMLVRMSGLFVTAPFFGSRNVSGYYANPGADIGVYS